MAAPPHLQTKPRSSEVGNTMRRSFSGNPFPKPSIVANQKGGFNHNTPANSPSDYPRRQSFSRENTAVPLRDEDKENGRDQSLKPLKLRSPASSKGTKHFMSPTISASSKINASPRKKVLGERNEPIRTSISFFDGKNSSMEDCDSKPEKGSSQKKEVTFDTSVTYLEYDDAAEVDGDDFDAKTAELTSESFSDMGKDCVNLDPSFEISPRVPCSEPVSSLAPLDADPSMPPYDPKTNYLSPRPQFLHYRPNPRIELYLSAENEGKRLDESFTSESNSDADMTEEESRSENWQKEAEEENAEVEEESELPLTETASINTVEVKKSPFFTRTKFIVVLLLVASACFCVSVNNLPVMEANVLNNLSFSEIVEFTINTFNDIGSKLQRSLYDSLSCIHGLVSSFRDRHKIHLLQYANLTIMADESFLDNGNNVFGLTRQAEVVINEPVEELEDDNIEYEEDDLRFYSEAFDYDQSAEEVFEDEPLEEDITAENDQTPQSAGSSIDEAAVQEENLVQEDAEAHNLKTKEKSEFTEPEELNIGSVNLLDDAKAETSQRLEIAEENPTFSESRESAFDDFSEISSEKKSICKISMLILTVLGTTVFLYIRTQRHPTKNAKFSNQQTKAKNRSPMPVSQNLQTEVDEVCPSEMSSYQNSSAQSQDRRLRKNYRRESLASSDYSSGSPSYGSFTTYEKIPTKLGYADEEVITPVRRSSRIRNLVTSP